MKLIAIKPHRFDGYRRVGDTYEATPAEARLVKALKWAADAPAVRAPVVAASPPAAVEPLAPPAVEPERVKRAYRRRDMVAEGETAPAQAEPTKRTYTRRDQTAEE